MPNPDTLFAQRQQVHRSPSVTTATSFRDASDSIYSTSEAQHFHPYHSGPPGGSKYCGDHKINVHKARYYFLAQSCLTDCWLHSSVARRTLAQESLHHANSLAVAAGREQTEETEDILNDVRFQKKKNLIIKKQNHGACRSLTTARTGAPRSGEF